MFFSACLSVYVAIVQRYRIRAIHTQTTALTALLAPLQCNPDPKLIHEHLETVSASPIFFTIHLFTHPDGRLRQQRQLGDTATLPFVAVSPILLPGHPQKFRKRLPGGTTASLQHKRQRAGRPASEHGSQLSA